MMPLNQNKLLKLNIKQLEDNYPLEDKGFTTPDSSEVTPRVEHYLKKFDYNYISRPTVERLHRSSHFISDGQIEDKFSKVIDNPFDIQEKDKFGMFSMIPTFMNLLGTTLYLRIGTIVGEAGIILTLIQIIIGTIILTLTVLSMSAICTNGNIGNGGFYYLISRSMGPEIGAMFGCIYFLTNAIMVAFSIVGFTLEIQYIFQSLDMGIVELPSGMNDIRIVGLITLVLVSFIPFISLDFEAKSQWILFAIVIISLLDFFIGSLIPPTTYQKAYGIVGWNEKVFTTNLLPLFDVNNNFFTVFSLYFSAIAGDFTGMTMASTLKNPKVDVPKGSLLAIIASSVVYILQVIFFGCTSVRYASGDLSDVQFKNFTCDASEDCNFGLIPDQYLMSRASTFTIIGDRMHYVEPIFAAGLLSQALSSAMSSFISAPRILQSLGFDGLLPLTKWFSKGTGKHADPRRGYILTFLIAVLFIAISNFNIIANVISNCYLISWSLLNIAVFHSDYIHSPNWRPTFKYYNKWLSLLCGILCFVLMFCFDWISSLALLSIMTITYLLIIYYKPEADWGQTTESQLYKTTVAFAHKLTLKSNHVKNFRPSVLLLSGIPNKYMDLITMANDITRHRGMLVIGDIVNFDILYENRNKTITLWNNWLNDNKIKCFYTIVNANSISEGSNMLIQCCGLGINMSPNIVMIGFKEYWKQSTYEEVSDYFDVIHNVLKMQKSLIIHRKDTIRSEKSSESESNGASISSLDSINIKLKSNKNSSVYLKSMKFRASHIYQKRQFECNLNYEFNLIDIYWLYDDGGLTLLIPYIISQRSNWRKHKLRIFSVIQTYTETAEQNLKDLLDKFRIEYHQVVVLEYPKSYNYKSIGERFPYVGNTSFFCQNSREDIRERYNAFQDKTNKYLFLREVLEKHSKFSSLIVMTIEIPKRDMINAQLFMQWLDILSSEMPEFLFVRGNQKNVLTFYLD